MAYSADVVVEVTQYFYNGKVISGRGTNHNVTIQSKEVLRVTIKAKSMVAALDSIDAYRRSETFSAAIETALTAFGINGEYNMYVTVEKTPRHK